MQLGIVLLCGRIAASTAYASAELLPVNQQKAAMLGHRCSYLDI